jgi:hypothetical protein
MAKVIGTAIMAFILSFVMGGVGLWEHATLEVEGKHIII